MNDAGGCVQQELSVIDEFHPARFELGIEVARTLLDDTGTRCFTDPGDQSVECRLRIVASGDRFDTVIRGVRETGYRVFEVRANGRESAVSDSEIGRSRTREHTHLSSRAAGQHQNAQYDERGTKDPR